MKWTVLPIAEFGGLVGVWDSLNDAAGGSPILQSRFMLPLCEVFGRPQLKIALCENSHGPIAMGILVRKSHGRWQTFQPSQAPVGPWIQQPDVPVEQLLGSLLRTFPGYALSMGITQQDSDLLPRPAENGRLSTLDYITTACLTVGGSFEQYWAARGKNLRHNMKRQRARLEKEGIRTSLEMVTSPREVAQAIADYGELESAGWKAESGTAVRADNAQGRFYRAVLEAFCRDGNGRIYRYRFGDRVVAVDLCIQANSCLVILKTTHDESAKWYSPAFLMRQEIFERLFSEESVRRIEFYGKLMDWHIRWTDKVRTMYHLNYYRWALLSKYRAWQSQRRSSNSKPAQYEQVD